ncbi:hypothetical protein [Vibrio sp. TBV020]|uniref:hypothetical protein n=1 Tax=Vibrio sp. TBV020 TaxID=3137398 RepID=UPI0038CD3783
MRKPVNNKKEISVNHISVQARSDTITQVKLRIEMLNEFIRNGVPEGFVAHKSMNALLEYEDSERGIKRRTYPAVYAKKGVKVVDIDPQFTGSPNTVVDCKDYLRKKIAFLKDEVNPTTKKASSKKSSSKIKSKAELNAIIKQQSEIVASLAREVLTLRSENLHLASLLKERDVSGRSLKGYYEKHHQSLLKDRKAIVPDVKSVIDNLEQIADELGDVTVESNVFSFSAKGK